MMADQMSQGDSKGSNESPTSRFSLLDLGEDALRAVLMRTRASDHPNLRLTCKRIRDIVDSSLFRKERSEQEYAEVRVEMLTPFEVYQRCSTDALTPDDQFFLDNYDELGYAVDPSSREFETSDFRVYVDGVPLHKQNSRSEAFQRELELKLQMLSFGKDFYEACEGCSSDVQRSSIRLFSAKGEPRVASLQKALANNVDGEDMKRKALLFVEAFELPFEYRSSSNIVGPSIIRSLLSDTRLSGHWTLALYIPYESTQFLQSDEDERDQLKRLYARKQSEEAQHTLIAFEQRCKQLCQQDMRQFIRAGFQQVDDRTVVNECYYMFAIPEYLSKRSGILSRVETYNRSLILATPPPPEKTGVAKEIQDLFIRQCRVYQGHQNSLQKSERSVEDSFPDIFRPLGFIMRQSRERLNDYESMLDEINEVQSLHKQDPELSTVDGLEDVAADLDLDISTMTLSQSLGAIQEALRTNISKFRKNVAETQQEYDRQAELSRGKIERKQAGQKQCLTSVMDKTREEMFSILKKSTNNEDGLKVLMESNAIHVCIECRNMELAGLLLDLLRKGGETFEKEALNRSNRDGYTCLMVAAMSADVGQLRNGQGYSFCESLLAMGADKNILHPTLGRSALGCFRQSFNDLLETQQGLMEMMDYSEEIDSATKKMENLLMPDQGPSPEDEAANHNQDSSSSDEEMDEDDDLSDEEME